MLTLGVIGCGNMGEALVKGILNQGEIKKEEIIIYDQNKKRNQYMEENYGVGISDSGKEILTCSKYILLAVKPQNITELLDTIKDNVTEKNIFISIIAGIPTYYIEKKIGGKTPVVRIMPNTPALVNRGVFAISKGKYADEKELNFVIKLLGYIGEVIKVDENYQNLVTALSGSGPAYFFLFCKLIIDAGVKNGIDANIAKKLVVETMLGSAEIIKNVDKDIQELIDMVTSPGGTTEKALEVFKDLNLDEIIENAINAAFKRANELEKQLDS